VKKIDIWVKRIFDFGAASTALLILFIPMFLIALIVKLSSKGPAIYWSNRVGKNNRIFKMPKFRSMNIDTPSVASNLLDNPDYFLTKVGKIIRRTSLDELPQLYSIIRGDMSIVGPRPALFNQDDLILRRIEKGVDQLVPGLTGWAQVNGRDELPIRIKVEFEVEYLMKHSFWFDIKIIWLTLLKVLKNTGVSH
jgi:O-antigen biosynthesis protein WbqP